MKNFINFLAKIAIKILQSLLLKIVKENSCVKIDAFLNQNGSFIFSKRKRTEAKELI